MGQLEKLSDYLNRDFAQAVARGDSYDRIIKQLRQRFKVSKKDAFRLVYTEGTYIQREAQASVFEENGSKDYTFHARYSQSQVCEACAVLDGKTFLLKDRQPGVNFPPMHPHCHCYYTVGRVDVESNYAAAKTMVFYNDVNLEVFPITIESIQNVKKFIVICYLQVLQSKLQNEHKKLLMEAAKHPPGTELGATFTLKMEKLGQVIGEPGASAVVIPKETVPYIAVHNHPTGGTFTHTDLNHFANNPNMRMLTAVGNDGTVYVVEKTMAFSVVNFQFYYDEVLKRPPDYLSTPQAYIDYIEDFLKGSEKCGIWYYSTAKSAL